MQFNKIYSQLVEKKKVPLMFRSIGTPLMLNQYILRKLSNKKNYCEIVGLLSNQQDTKQLFITGCCKMNYKTLQSVQIYQSSSQNSLQQIHTYTQDQINQFKSNLSLQSKQYGNNVTIGQINLNQNQNYGLVQNQNDKVYLAFKGTQFQEHEQQILKNTIIDLLNQGLSLLQACQQCLQRQNQNSPFCIIVQDKQQPDQIVLASFGIPIFIGEMKNGIVISTKKLFVQQFTNQMFILKQGEIMDININQIGILGKKNSMRQSIENLFQKQMSCDIYEQEVYEQINSVDRMFTMNIIQSLERNKKLLSQLKNLIIIASGSYYYASQLAKKYSQIMQSFDSVSVLLTSEVEEYDLIVENGGVIIISIGDSKTEDRLLQLAKNYGILTIKITNQEKIFEQNYSDISINLNIQQELSETPSKSFSQVALALIIASSWFAGQQNKLKGDNKFTNDIFNMMFSLENNYLLGVDNVLQNIEQQCQIIAKELCEQQSIFIIANGFNLPIAQEGALKLNKLSLIHTEAQSSGEFLEGSLSLIHSQNDCKTTVIMIILQDNFIETMLNTLERINQCHGKIIVISNCPQLLQNSQIDWLLEIQQQDILSPLYCILPLQLIAVEISKIKQTKVDYDINTVNATPNL